MRFTVMTADGKDDTFDGTYDIGSGGELTVKANAETVVYSPTWWRQIEHPTPPAPKVSVRVMR